MYRSIFITYNVILKLLYLNYSALDTANSVRCLLFLVIDIKYYIQITFKQYRNHLVSELQKSE